MNLGKAIACLKELGVTPNLSDFQSKLVIQKTVFLLELKKIDLGFNYSMYAHGPYSPDLTKQLYRHKPDVEGLNTSEKLSVKEREVLQEFKALFGLPGRWQAGHNCFSFNFRKWRVGLAFAKDNCAGRKDSSK